jgi:hypothetical protein
VPDGDAVDREQRVQVVGETRDRRRVFAAVGVDEPVCGLKEYPSKLEDREKLQNFLDQANQKAQQRAGGSV